MIFQYENNRIFALGDDHRLLAEVTFPFCDDNRVEINHTYVHDNLRGQGIASRLMELAYDFLKQKNLKAIATCPYSVAWFAKHPEYQDILIK